MATGIGGEAETDDPLVLGVSVEGSKYASGNVKITVGVTGSRGDDPLAYLELIRMAKNSLDESVAEAVHRARAQRLTWEEIGDALGVTRQSAWERYSVD